MKKVINITIAIALSIHALITYALILMMAAVSIVAEFIGARPLVKFSASSMVGGMHLVVLVTKMSTLLRTKGIVFAQKRTLIQLRNDFSVLFVAI